MSWLVEQIPANTDKHQILHVKPSGNIGHVFKALAFV